ncbi:aminotransferase class V-fold PLP-dependent enzyme [Myxococcota bacterium]|nr:aminotransferase class V-fold PLP-dependent enzyme [Myxococcota bacterium]MBU1381027.1 aminotransferase class V-fold PLP-dependent enzyme [Myxococcota bacterium]MBU1499078.1 aminotransferase class V-fold PLP-dependent enzyme [Myxococcota bacterium]
MNRIYLDNASTTKLLPSAALIRNEIAQTYEGNASASHSEGKKSRILIENFKEKVKKITGFSEHDVIFTPGATYGNNLAISIGSSRGRILTGDLEHASIYRFLEIPGAVSIPSDKNGLYNPELIRETLQKERFSLVSLMLASNELGTRQNIEKIAEIIALSSPKTLFHVDAVQGFSPGQWFKSSAHIDLVTLSAHKFHGPLGSGILLARSGLGDLDFIRGGGQQKFLSGTLPVDNIAATVSAMEEVWKLRNTEFEKRCAEFTSILESETKDLLVTCATSPRIPWIVNVSLPGLRGEIIVRALDTMGIIASWSSACSSGKGGLSRSLKSIGADPSRGYIRLAYSVFTTEAEVSETARTLSEIVKNYSVVL